MIHVLLIPYRSLTPGKEEGKCHHGEGSHNTWEVPGEGNREAASALADGG